MQVLEAEYIKDFKCDGGHCDSNCCKNGWIIDIDNKTLLKYKNMQPAEKSNEILKNIAKWEGNNVIKLKEDKSCPFLGEDSLCKLQRTYGEEYLSKTCKTYPRLLMRTEDNFATRSLSIVCPAACHLALTRKRPVKFHTFEIRDIEEINYLDFRKLRKAYMLPLLQATGANILEEESLTIDQRLGVLALFAESAWAADSADELANISETFEKEVLKEAKELLKPLMFNPEEFLKEMFTFLRALFLGWGANHDAKLYVNFIVELFELMEMPEEKDVVDLNKLDLEALDYDKILKLYQERYLPAKEELMKDFAPYAQYYLTHTYLLSGAPVRNKAQDFRVGMGKFILEYKLAEMVFVCFKYKMGKKFHEVGLELAAADFTRMLEHNLTVSGAIDDKFKNVNDVIKIIQLYLDV